MNDLILLDQRKAATSKSVADEECGGDGILRADGAPVGAPVPAFKAAQGTKDPRRKGWVSCVDSSGAPVVSMFLPVKSGEKYFFHWAGYVIALLMCDRRGGSRYSVLVNDIACLFDAYRTVIDKRAHAVQLCLTQMVAAAIAVDGGAAELRRILSYDTPYTDSFPVWYVFHLQACVKVLNSKQMNTRNQDILKVNVEQVRHSFRHYYCVLCAASFGTLHIVTHDACHNELSIVI
jgi:hypothetical protein